MITSEELNIAIENNANESNVKVVAENLLEAIRDWPTENLSEPSEFVAELKLEINQKLTFENIAKFLKTLRVEKDAWKIESLSSLLEIFDWERTGKVDREIELEVLLDRITELCKA